MAYGLSWPVALGKKLEGDGQIGAALKGLRIMAIIPHYMAFSAQGISRK